MVAIELFGFGIHWYGLLYLCGFLLAWWMLPRLQGLRALALTRDDWATILTAGVVGVLVGGRLGYVLFYAPGHYFLHPLEVFAVWNGGMASHGGFLGVTLALLWVLRHRTVDQVLAIGDLVVVPVAIGLALGRFGNFINQELYGTVTTLPWGMSIPGVVGLRHPTQIYAVIKDLFIAGVCFVHLRATSQVSNRKTVPGQTAALFLMLYGVLRFLLEFLRAQESAPIDLGIAFSRGQLLTLPVFIAGVLLWVGAAKRKQ
jgi:phosphatidylglycerol:prolipoprotein diacylglycerol transferase